MSDSQQTFRKAYEILRRNADRLDQEEVDIDELVPLVEQSTEAYRICKSRLDAVEKALQEALGDSVKPSDQESQSQPSRTARTEKPAPNFSDMDDEIPF
jgi:exodeoxyribonuclease VII small subunit